MEDSTTSVSYPDQGHKACLLVEDQSFWFRHRNECISALVASCLPDGRFADVGGGNGFVARRLQDDGLDVILVEPGADGARNARDVRGVRNVVCATLGSAELGTLDGVGAFDVVEHVEDDAAFVGAVADSLHPGGWFFATVPAHQWLWSGADEVAGHFRRYTRRSFEDLLAPYFDVVFSSYFFAPLVPAIALLRALPYRLGAKQDYREDVAAREHGTEGGAGSSIIERMLEREVPRIRAQRPVLMGASLIVAARKR